MRRRSHNMTFRTPYGKGKVEADTWEELIMLCPGAIASALEPESWLSEDIIAREARASYHTYFGSHVRSRIELAGLELVVIKCYLHGKTIAQTVSYLSFERGFKTSQTAVGRYFARLRWLKIAKSYR